MPILLVAYEIHTEGKTGEKLKNALKRRDDILAFVRRYDHRHLSGSCYAIEAHLPAEEYAHDVLELTEDEDDELYIMPLVGPLISRGPDDVREWLEPRLRRPG